MTVLPGRIPRPTARASIRLLCRVVETEIGADRLRQISRLRLLPFRAEAFRATGLAGGEVAVSFRWTLDREAA